MPLIIAENIRSAINFLNQLEAGLSLTKVEVTVKAEGYRQLAVWSVTSPATDVEVKIRMDASVPSRLSVATLLDGEWMDNYYIESQTEFLKALKRVQDILIGKFRYDD